jgi:hypothetical protein
MKNKIWYSTIIILFAAAFMLTVLHPADATILANNPYHLRWESRHANMINAQLLTSHAQIVAGSFCFVNLAREYALRDPLLSVYGTEATLISSRVSTDAFLLGLKANNLTYLIHTADANPEARVWAVREMRTLSRAIDDPVLRRHLRCWIVALENRLTPSTRISHTYVHYTPDIGDVVAARLGEDARRHYFMGYLVNDFMVASVTGRQYWIAADQNMIVQVGSVYSLGAFERQQADSLRRFSRINLNGPGAVQQAVDELVVVRRNSVNYGDQRVFTPFRSVY